MKADRLITYTEHYEAAKHDTRASGAELGAVARSGVERVSSVAQAGAVFAVIAAGHVAGFAQGVWRGVLSRPNV